MKNKVIAMTFLLLACLFILSGCASTGADKTEQSLEETPQIPLFADWKYKGFGQEYPKWAEDALKEGASSTVEIHFGNNLDMLIWHEQKEIESNVIAQTWVYIDPYYDEYEERYAYITLRRAQEPQGMEE